MRLQPRSIDRSKAEAVLAAAKARAFVVFVALAAWAATLAPSSRAFAFGGLWSAGPIEQTGTSIIFVDHPDATVTAIVRLEHQEPAPAFAWLIPVRGKPVVSVSSKLVFHRLDAETSPQYWVEEARTASCATPDGGSLTEPTDAPGGDAPSALELEEVSLVDRGSAAPYEYVTLAIDPNSGDPASAALGWLSENGYDLTGFDSQVLGSYLKEGHNLLALKFAGGAMRPLVLTYESERPVIPLALSARSAQSDLPLRVWVLGPSQAVPTSDPSLILNDALFDWLGGATYAAGTLPANGAGPFGPTSSIPSNYDPIVSAAVREAGGRGFVTELAEPVSRFRKLIWSDLDAEDFERTKTQPYADAFEALVTAHGYYAEWDGWAAAVRGATTLPEGMSVDAFAREPSKFRGVAQVDATKLWALLEEHVIAPMADTAALLLRAPYLTRFYTTLRVGEPVQDPAFDYNPDLAQVSNIHIARRIIDCDPAQPTDERSWRAELPQGGVVVGVPGGGWPLDVGSMPANLKVVTLSNRGSGTVVADNSAVIRTKLAEAGGATVGEMPALHPQPHGVTIGGMQTVKPFEPPGPSPFARKPAKDDDGGCRVTHPGAGSRSALAGWLLLMAAAGGRRRRRRGTSRRWITASLALSLLGACSEDATPVMPNDAGPPLPTGALTAEQLRDPESCKGCHPIHYREWSSSMHAYAAKDPVFLAMNRRGQRETNGELGSFCVKCHAPMALLDGRTEDGLNLEELPDLEHGVSCYFCHNMVGVEGNHNGLLRLANDATMRGPIEDPVPTAAHRAEYSEFFEATGAHSSTMCGSCHDIVTPTGVHLERTFKEYQAGLFSKSATGEPPANGTCVGCHMPGRQGFAAIAPEGVQPRMVHEHLWPGIDVALIDFPNREAMRSAVEDCQLGQPSLSFFTLEVTPPDLFTFQLETNAGHNQPSGAAQDRRMWLEFLAYDENGALLPEVSSGNIADGEIEEKPVGDPKHDPHLLMFRDRIFDAQGKPVHMFWEAEKSATYPDGYQTQLLPVATTTYIEGRHAVVKQYRASTADGRLPSRVTARLKIRPIGFDVLHDLVESGDLDPAIAASMPTFTFGARIDWTPQDGLMKPVSAQVKTDCSSYVCLLDPSAPNCP